MEAKYHVVKVSTSGLGDAIKSVLIGALYANMTGRVLFVDWHKSLYSEDDENSFFDFFKLRNVSYVDESFPHKEANTMRTNPKRWEGQLGNSFHEIYESDNWPHWDRESAISLYSLDMTELDHPEPITVSWDFDQAIKIMPHFPECASIDDLFSFAARQHLSIRESIVSKVDDICRKLKSDFVAVHLRITNEFDLNKGCVSLEETLKTLKSIKALGSASIFLACDNLSAQRVFMQRYPQTITIDKWFGEPGTALHLNAECPSPKQNAIDAITDLLILSRSKILICNLNSSFAQVATIFSKRKDIKVIDTNRSSTRKRIFKKITGSFSRA